MRDGALADPNGTFGIGIQNLGLLRYSNPLIPEFCPARLVVDCRTNMRKCFRRKAN